jgi:hypothetical protein
MDQPLVRRFFAPDNMHAAFDPERLVGQDHPPGDCWQVDCPAGSIVNAAPKMPVFPGAAADIP